ncbi:MAG: RloB family protein, partial [Clostridiales Family XIII bacterium]|nr:RloB family protein [Clostridiales Family XIII bacterium]
MQDNPQIILICCEGKTTEKLYFEILKNVLKISNIAIQILPKSGQHYHLIDKCAEKKQTFSSDFNFVPDDIEVWAVCDRDNLKDSFTRLNNYATDNGV